MAMTKRDRGEDIETGTDIGMPIKLEAAIGAEIRRLRKRQDMTMAALAESAGLSQGMLSKIETGQTSPSLATLSALADALAVPISAFFGTLEQSRDVSYVPADRVSASTGAAPEPDTSIIFSGIRCAGIWPSSHT